MSSVVARENKEEEEEEKEWSDLPCDLLYFISLRLYAGDSIMFRAVCKCWQSIPHPRPMQIDLPLNEIDPQLRNIPYLMTLNSRTGLFHFHHPVTNTTYIADIPELAKEEIRCSKDGWLLICCRPESVFFFNPFRRTRVNVPRIPLKSGFQSMHFSGPPTLSGCTVLGVFSDNFEDISIGTFRLDRETWSIHIFENKEEFLLSKCSPVLYRGLYYCLGRGGNLGIFDPVNDTWNVLGKPLDRLKKCQQSFLLESDGNLFGVFVANNGRKIEVLRMQRSPDLAWHEVESLEGKMFYVCYKSSCSSNAEISGAGNNIYFPKFYDDKGLFYSLRTRQYHSFLSSVSKQDLSDAKDMKQGIWINMPLH